MKTKQKNKVVQIVTVMILVLGLLTACGSNGNNSASSESPAASGSSAAASEGKALKVAYTTMTLGSPYFVEVSNGVKAKCEEYGWDCQIHDAKGEVSTQISALENFIAQKYDVILISPLEENASKGIIKKAVDAGIKVIDLNSPVEGADVFITPDEYDMGYTIGKAAGEWAKANVQGKVKVVTYNVKEHPSTLTREKGMREAITEIIPDAEFVASLSALTPEDGMKNMEGLIQAHPDINIVIGCNDAGIMGSYQVAKSANLDLTKMYFGGIDAIPQALDLIKKEKEAGKGAYRGTVDITPFKTGEVAIETAKKVVDGETVDKKIIIPAKLVNWDNIGEY